MSSLDFSDLKALFDLPSVIQSYTGQAITKKGIVCPFSHHVHSKRTPSLFVFAKQNGEQWFKCFGNCGAKGDVIDFVGYMTYGGRYNPRDSDQLLSAAQWLMQKPVVPVKHHIDLEPKKELSHAYAIRQVRKWQDALWESVPAQEYLEKRGVLSVARQFMLGYRCLSKSRPTGHYIAIPAIENGRVRAVKFRRIDSHPDYQFTPQKDLPIRYWAMSGSRASIFGHDFIAFQPGFTFVPEGEMDAMLMTALGYQACALTAGAEHFDERLGLILAHAKPILIQDGDKAGEMGVEKRLVGIPWSTSVTTIPYHDIGWMYEMAGGDVVKEWADNVISELSR